MEFSIIKLTAHALIRMEEREIAVEEIRRILTEGALAEAYEDDTPYPSYLLCGMVGSRPLHVLAALNRENGEAIIVTVYEPDPARWEEGFLKRKKEK